MNISPIKVDQSISFEKEITFCTLVTKMDEYQDMLKSAEQSGFCNEKVEYLFFDNIQDNYYDGFSGINRAILSAKGRYIIYCHQDILFKQHGYDDLIEKLEELNKLDDNWAVAGNAGKDAAGNLCVMISDPNGENQRAGSFPAQVISLDENFLIINHSKGVAASSNVSGYHLYGIDICQNAIGLGLSCYVIDFHLLHKSAGSIDKKFFNAQKKYIKIATKRKKYQFLSTTCTNFYVTNNFVLNAFLNNFFSIRLICYAKKLFRKITLSRLRLDPK